MLKDLDRFYFRESLVNETAIRQLHAGQYLQCSHNTVLVGDTETGIRIWRSHLLATRSSTASGCLFSVVDLVNQLDAESATVMPVDRSDWAIRT